MTAQTIEVGGVQVIVEGQGPETVLMLHGWPDTHRLWDATVLALQDRFRCCRFTWPGFEPGAKRAMLTVDEIVQLVGQVVDAVAPGGRVILLLHDWGCSFGYQFYMRHPERVSRIVGVDIGDAHALARTLPKRQMMGIMAYQMWLATAWKIGGAVGDAMTRRMAKSFRVPADIATIRATMNWPYALTWMRGEQSLRRRAIPFRPQCPMLFIWGRRKPLMFHSPAWPDKVRALPNGRAEPFETGHWVMAGEPERFNALVREWLVETA